MRRLSMVIVAVAGICGAIPAAAEEVGIGVGPSGVIVGTDHRDRDRDHKTVIINKDRDHDGDRDKTVIINNDRDHGGDRDHDRRSIVIDRN
jgi:hypothetical protein